MPSFTRKLSDAERSYFKSREAIGTHQQACCHATGALGSLADLGRESKQLAAKGETKRK